MAEWIKRPNVIARLAIATIAVLGPIACGDDDDGDGSGNEPGPPVALVVVSGQSQSAEAGTSLAAPVVVRVVDEEDNPVSGQVVNFIVTAGGGDVFAGVAITNSSGLAQEIWTLGDNPADSQHLEARAVDPESGDPLVFAHFSADALPLPADTMFVVTGATQEGYASDTTRTRPVVTVRDRLGGPVAGTAVTFTVPAGSGTLAGTTVINTDSAGNARAPIWILAAGTSTDTLLASVTGLTTVTMTAVPVAFATVSANDMPCGLTTGSHVRCWGQNQWGGLGVGDTLPRQFPVYPVGDPTFDTVLSSGQFACGLTAGGAVWCWGANHEGQLGDGTQVHRYAPVPVSGGLTFSAIAVGSALTCGLQIGTGNAYCWGANWGARLGLIGPDSTAPLRALTPTAVSGGLAFTRIVIGGSHACALAPSGVAYCWGERTGGFTGVDTFPPILDTIPFGEPHLHTPIGVAGGHLFASISTNGSTTCGVTAAGAAWCWGDNAQGQTGKGDGSTKSDSIPVLVSGGHTWEMISAGGTTVCGLTTAGTAYCWGLNVYGSVGNGSTANPIGPTLVAGGLTFASISTGNRTSCGVTPAGKIYCWGANDMGQVGDGTTTDRSVPVLVRP
jgi:alpha-tubulin suppressor-like RCC1 family protein